MQALPGSSCRYWSADIVIEPLRHRVASVKRNIAADAFQRKIGFFLAYGKREMIITC